MLCIVFCSGIKFSAALNRGSSEDGSTIEFIKYLICKNSKKKLFGKVIAIL